MKSKGSRTERELVHLFNDTKLWAAIRIAGSGLTKDSNPDVLVGNNQRYLAIECKSLKNKIKYLTEEDIAQITDFAERFGAEAWFGIRFDREGWYFIKPNNLEKIKTKNYAVSLPLVKEKGLSFEELIKIKNGQSNILKNQ